MTDATAAVPTCSGCNRPLQRGRDSCMYCGRPLEKSEIEALESAVDDDLVAKKLKEAEVMLGASEPPAISASAKLGMRVIVVVLAVAATVFISWLSEWNPVFIVLAALFFAIPVWHVFRKL